MRIISGNKRGLPLKAVTGHTTRPTSDKVKESIFNIIGPFFNGGQALDLYAGSGGLGIEALSRGLDHVIFVDQDKKAIETVKQNITMCGYESNAKVYRNDAVRALKAIAKRNISFSYIFLDPPYFSQHLTKDIQFINDFNLLNSHGTIVCEHAAKIILPANIGHMIKSRAETYGDTTISIFQLINEGDLL